MIPSPPSPDFRGDRLAKIYQWARRHPYWVLSAIVVVMVCPFLGKPFNMDDPLFIWAARQIQVHPADPYGFNVEWGWRLFPMWKVTENPPLASYFLALAGGAIGWTEIAVHAAFLAPALAAILGTHRLARHFCQSPVLAAAAALFTPVFMVSATTVMCDVPMLAFWVWATVFWIEGLEQNHFRKLLLAAALISLAEMTKYFGACLMPLLAAFALIDRHPLKQWGPFLLLPLATLCLYQLLTQAAYGESLLYLAGDYAAFSRDWFGFSRIAGGVTALAFCGGCLAVTVFFIPLTWSRKAAALLAGGAVPVAGLLFSGGALAKKYPSLHGPGGWFEGLQVIFWAACGIGVLALAFADVRHRRDARSWLLALWMGGVLFFAAFLNWTVNARSFLPLVPVAGILLARRLEQNAPAGGARRFPAVAICLAASAALAWWLAWADYRLAVAVRQCAREVAAKGQPPGGTLWFQGHWGFQYYMESSGASAFDFKTSAPKDGDLVAIPANNTNLLPPAPARSALWGTLFVPGPRFLTTWNETLGAGFYASARGPLPFALGAVPPESVSVYVLGTSPANPAKPR
jgi:4-amino-4-deoxy-L-arabinose transferase-like glycosyltransferase